MTNETMNSIISFLQYIGKLKSVTRAGWKNYHIKDAESVADHSFRTAVFAMVLGKKLGVNEAKLIKMALVHDIGESVIGDLIQERGRKEVIPQEKKVAKEGKAVEMIVRAMKGRKEVFDLWLEYAKGKTKEARILKQLDKIEMTLQALEYEKGRTSKKLDEFWINAKKYVREPLLKDMLKELEALREK